MTLSNADKLRFAEVEDTIERELGGNSDTMDFLMYLERLKEENEDRQSEDKKIQDEIEYIRSYALSFSHIENIDQTDPMLFEFAYDVYQRTNYILEELEK